MARFPRTLKELCTPAAIYFILSMIGLVIVLFQNLGDSGTFYVGDFSSKVPNTFVVLLIQFIYILFWTYVLNLICRDGHSALSWFIVFLPILLMFVLTALMMVA
jgi:H+/Cl- antiporter ClcA